MSEEVIVIFLRIMKAIKAINKRITFEKIRKNKKIYLYAGDIPNSAAYKNFIGLSLNREDKRHIKHNILRKHELYDNSVDIYQSEDVFEHISIADLPDIIAEIYRILKPGGIFRLSLPDYRCDVLYERCLKNEKGEILFDPFGGGDFLDGEVVNGGHVWFPRYEIVSELLMKSPFKIIDFYHYYDENGMAITKKIDYSIGFIQRTPDNDERVKKPYRPMSIVVDCIK